MTHSIAVPPKVGSHRYVTLDGMRGVAAFLVMWMHFTLNGPLDQVGPVALFKVASLAVDFFFMLSGFVLAYAYTQKLNAGLSGLNYMRQRVLRLYPMFLFGTLIGMVAVGLMVRQGTVQMSSGFFAKAAGLNLLFLPVFHAIALPNFANTEPDAGSIAIFNGPAWSLFFEMVASLSFILLARWRTRATAAFTALSFIVMTVVAWRVSHQNGFSGVTYAGGTSRDGFLAGFPRVFFGFYMGVLLYHWREKTASVAARLPAFLLSPWLLYAVLAAALAFPWTLKGLYPAAVLVFVAPALVMLGSRSVSGGPVTERISHGLGWLSYPLYCVHVPIGRLVWMLAGAYHWPVVATTLLAVAASVAGAALMALFLEAPVKRLLGQVLPGRAR